MTSTGNQLVAMATQVFSSASSGGSSIIQKVKCFLTKKGFPALSTILAFMVTLGSENILQLSNIPSCPCYNTTTSSEIEDSKSVFPAFVLRNVNFGLARIFLPAVVLFILVLVFNANTWKISQMHLSGSGAKQQKSWNLKHCLRSILGFFKAFRQPLGIAGIWLFVTLLRGKSFVCAVRNRFQCLVLDEDVEKDYETTSRLIAISFALIVSLIWLVARIVSGCFADTGRFQHKIFDEYKSKKGKILEDEQKELLTKIIDLEKKMLEKAREPKPPPPPPHSSENTDIGTNHPDPETGAELGAQIDNHFRLLQSVGVQMEELNFGSSWREKLIDSYSDQQS